MGAALWVSSAVTAFGIARIVPSGRRKPFGGELLVAIAAALILGAGATAADFGGWNEIDWRAAGFVFCGAAAAIATMRLRSLTRRAA